MVWYRLDDVDYDAPLVLALFDASGGNGPYGSATRIGQYSSTHRLDGWIPRAKVGQLATRTELRYLTTVRVGDVGPMLHEPGDRCPCLEGREWPDEPGYVLHGFLRRNPTRSENDVHVAKRRELRDKELRAAVKARDGLICRYCGITVKVHDRKTAAGLVLDHVDPRIANGAANLVVACRGCNSRKKDCTPAAAGLELQPPPGEREPATYPAPAPDQPQNSRRSTDPAQIGPRSAIDAAPGAQPSPDPLPGRSSAATHGLTTPRAGPITGDIRDQVTTGTGRGGQRGRPRSEPLDAGDAGPAGYRPTVGPPTTPREPGTANPYMRSHTNHAGYPPPTGEEPTP